MVFLPGAFRICFANASNFAFKTVQISLCFHKIEKDVVHQKKTISPYVYSERMACSSATDQRSFFIQLKMMFLEISGNNTIYFNP